MFSYEIYEIFKNNFFTELFYSDVTYEKARTSRPELLCKKFVFENFANQRCFPLNFPKFSRTPFFI